LRQELRGGRQFVAARREDELHQPTAEGGTVDALSRRGEEHLLDQVTDVVVARRFGGAFPVVEVIRIVDLDRHHVPVTLTCVMMTEGGPCGICSGVWQGLVLVWRMAG
jgi:hypothetical protein